MPRLHVRHFYFTGKTLLSDLPWIVRPECCMRCSCGQRYVLEQNRWDSVAENSSNWTFCNMLQILGFEDDDLPVQVKKSACVATALDKDCVHFSRTPFKTCFWTLGKSCWRTYFWIVQLWLSETINYFDGKKLLNCQCPSCFQCSTIPVVSETHTRLSWCLRCRLSCCLMKLLVFPIR